MTGKYQLRKSYRICSDDGRYIQRYTTRFAQKWSNTWRLHLSRSHQLLCIFALATDFFYHLSRYTTHPANTKSLKHPPSLPSACSAAISSTHLLHEPYTPQGDIVLKDFVIMRHYCRNLKLSRVTSLVQHCVIGSQYFVFLATAPRSYGTFQLCHQPALCWHHYVCALGFVRPQENVLGSLLLGLTAPSKMTNE